MKSLLRPSLLAFVSAALALGALALVLWPLLEASPANQAIPRPVPEGDREIVWLNPATSAVTWERFVTAVRHVQTEHSALGLQLDDTNGFPRQTTAVPEIVVGVPGCPSRLWVRWYKLTSDATINNWVEALTSRRPSPLAIIGGGSSDRARDLAQKLKEVGARVTAPPLLLITTATADEVWTASDPPRMSLTGIYPGRTFRFCFTNRQMAEAVTDFVWSRHDLRPDAEPVYMAAWQDDPYSEDLADQFREVLWNDYRDAFRQNVLRQAVSHWLWTSSKILIDGIPAGMIWQGLVPTRLGPRGPFCSARIPYSIGTFNEPNRPEAEAAEKLMTELMQHPQQRRPLLVLPATAQPARRFLRGLMRVAPTEADRFVVVTGDSIDFNTLFRDRNLTWPIQDLPFELILFCHRNPVAHAREEATWTGTEDLLLFADIVETVVGAAFQDGRLIENSDRLGERLRKQTPRFDAEGNRPKGTGEFVVHLQPQRDGERIQPRALLSVYRTVLDGGRKWELVREVSVDYLRHRRAGGPAP